LRKRFVGLLAALVTTSLGLELEGHIVLPDSFGNVKWPGRVACNTVNNRVYVGGGSESYSPRLLVVDGATDARAGSIPVPEELAAMLYEPSVNKLYCAGAYSDSLLVIDGATNQLITSLVIPMNEGTTLASDPVHDRLYCASSHDELVVVDLHGDSVVTRFGVPCEPVKMCVNPVSNCVYLLWGHDYLTVVDAAGDSVLREAVVVLGDQSDICYNPVNNTVYVASQFSPGIWVVGGPRDTVIDSMPGVHDGFGLAFNPVDRRVYCCFDGGLAVVDAATNRVVDTIDAGYEALAMAVNSDENKLYIAAPGPLLTVVDCAAGVVIDTFETPWDIEGGIGLSYSSASRKVYCTIYDGDRLLVVDGAGDTVVAMVNTADVFQPGCVNTADGRLYGFDEPSGDVLVIDRAQNRVAARLPGKPYAEAMAYDPTGNKLYCTYNAESLWVFDGAGDTLRKRIWLWGGMPELLYHQPEDKLYCAGGSRYAGTDTLLLVVDCAQDELVATIRLPNSAASLCSNPALSKVYCSVYGGFPEPGTVAAIDPRADTVLALITVAPRPGQQFYNPVNNRVYVTHRDCESLSVIDCATDSLLHFVRLQWYGSVVGFSPVSNKLYIAADSELVVVDCGADTVLRVISIGQYITGRNAYDSVRNRLHVIAGWSRDVHVVDCATDSVVEVVPTGSWSGYPFWNPFNRRLYCSTWDEGRIAVLHDPAGVEERENREVRMEKAGATIVRSVLCLLPSPSPFPPGEGKVRGCAVLLDAAGRKVMELSPGPNDVHLLPAGVYFVVTPSPVSSPPEGERVGVRGREASGVKRDVSSVERVSKVIVTR
jgi:DNA-binding beta-propeller fold protein YncE